MLRLVSRFPDLLICNPYSQTKSQDAIRHTFDDMCKDDEEPIGLTGNPPSTAVIYPDYTAPIIRHGSQGGWQLTRARWGKPTPQAFLKDKHTDPGAANGMLHVVAEGVRKDAA